MDAALLLDQIVVVAADGRRVIGTAQIDHDDAVWRFHAATGVEPW